LRTVSNQLLARRHAVPPDVLIGPVRGHLGYLRTLLDGPAPPAVQRELGGLAADAAVFAGLTEFSAARTEQARGYYAFARALAAEFGHPALNAHALMKESLLHSRLLFAASPRDTEIALAMLGQAAATSAPLPAPMRASLAAQRAEEHAHLKQAAAYHHALEE